MRTLILAFRAFVLFMPMPVLAQQIGTELSVWSLGRGASSANASTRTTGTVRLGVPLRSARSVLQAGASFASEREDAAGLLHLDVELAQRVLDAADGAFNLFASGGLGALRFSADRQQAIIAECDRNPLCLYESIPIRTGWRPTLSTGFGADLPITDALLLQPTARIVTLLGNAGSGPDNARVLWRLGVGLTWRR